VLADRGAACLAAADDFAVAISQLLQQLDVFVVDVSWSWTFAVDEKRILANGFRLEFWFTT